MNFEAMGITREEVLELAAQKLADECLGDQGDIVETSQRLMENRLETAIVDGLKEKIDAFLTSEMERLVSTDFVPVDIFGEATGEPTTIRAALHERAKHFWLDRVNRKDGTPETWGGIPRHEYIFRQAMAEEFQTAIKANISEIVTGFKDALRIDAGKAIGEHIEKLMPNKR